MVQKNCTIILIYAQISRQNCKLLLQLSHCVILGCLAFPFFFLRTPLSQWHPPLWVPSRTGPSCSPGVLSLCPPGSQLCPSCYPYTMSPSFLIYSFILEVHTLLWLSEKRCLKNNFFRLACLHCCLSTLYPDWLLGRTWSFRLKLFSFPTLKALPPVLSAPGQPDVLPSFRPTSVTCLSSESLLSFPCHPEFLRWWAVSLEPRVLQLRAVSVSLFLRSVLPWFFSGSSFCQFSVHLLVFLTILSSYLIYSLLFSSFSFLSTSEGFP